MILEPEEFLKIIRDNIKDSHIAINNVSIMFFNITYNIGFLHSLVAEQKEVYVIIDDDYTTVSIQKENKEIAKSVEDFYFTPAFKFIKLIAN